MYGLYTAFCIFIGIAILVIIVLLTWMLAKKQSYASMEIIRNLSIFITCFLIITIIYYLTTYNSISQGDCIRGTVGRVIEFIFCIALEYSWYRFIRANLRSKGIVCKVADFFANIMIIVFSLVAVFCCVFLLDEYYYAEGDNQKVFVTVFFACLAIGITAFNMFYMVKTIKVGLDRQTKQFVVIMSVVLSINEMVADISAFRLAWAKMPYTIESFYIDPSFFIMIFTAVVTLLYIFHHDFSPIFFRNEVEAEKVCTENTALDMIAEECRLTERERDVVKCIYDGLSYDDTAQRLYVSKYTVKNHVHNIYVKLQINSKNDLNNIVKDRMRSENSR